MSPLNLSKFLAPNDPLLNRVSEAIDPKDIYSTEIKLRIEEMLEVANGEQVEREKPLLVGLAAPQIGIMKRIILVDLKADGRGLAGDLQVMINPYILWHSDEEHEWYEGCFSTSRVCGIVSRSVRIRVKYFDQEGVTHEEEYTGYTARIIQHEIDHLNGQEFTSRITDDEKLHWVEKSEFFNYRNNGQWVNWPHKCTRARWNEIKGV